MAPDPERARNALELRKAGAAPERIAEALAFTDVAEAAESVRQSLADEAPEALGDAHRLELARLDALQRALWPGALQGQAPAIDRVLAIMERRAKLLGLDGKSEEKPEADALTDIEEQRAKRRARLAATANPGRA